MVMAKTKNRPPKNIKSTPFRVKVKSYFKHMNVKKLTSGGRNKILYKKMRSNYALVAWYSYVPALFVARNIFKIVIKIPVNASH